MDDSEISFSSHVELSDLGATNMQSVKSGSQKEVVGAVYWRHHRLGSCFRAWREVGKMMKEEALRRLKIAQKVSLCAKRRWFGMWQKRHAEQRSLKKLGDKIRAGVLMRLWRQVVSNGFVERKKFMKFLLIRRSIYQHKYIVLWRRILGLKWKYKQISKKANIQLGFKVVKALRIGARRQKYEKEQIGDVKMIRLFYQERACFRHWRMQLRYRRLERMVVESCDGVRQYHAFSVWKRKKQMIDARKRKSDAAESVSRKFALRVMFNRWYTRYYRRCSLLEIEENLKEMRRKQKLGACLAQWISKFNHSGYLSGCERDLLRRRRQIALKKYFGTWHSLYASLAQKYEFACGCAAEYNERRESRSFLLWKTRCAQSVFDRTMMRKAARRLRVFTLRRYLSKWHDKFRVSHDDRVDNAVAVKFRELGLKMKVFCAFKQNVKSCSAKRSADESAAEHYVLQLQRRAMRCWRRLHVKTIRRYVMITAVLKNWAHNVQLRQLQKWKRYTDTKRQLHSQTQEAFGVYRQRCMRLACTGFVLGAPRIPNPSDEPTFDEEEDLLATMLDDNEPSIIQEHKLTQPPLSAPKRPDFLGAASKTPATVESRPAPPPPPPPPNPEEEYEELAQRFLELKTKLESCSQSERPQTLQEFEALIARIAEVRSRVAEC